MTAESSRIAPARQLFAQFGATASQLRTQQAAASAVPTLADYLPRVSAAAGPGANRTYWTRMLTTWGERRLDEIAASDIEAMQQEMAATGHGATAVTAGTPASMSSPPPARSTTAPSPMV